MGLESASLILLVGLGNPGPSYAHHRHTIGFMALDHIHKVHTFSPFKVRDKVLVSEGKIGNHKVLLAKPMDYMNRSGRSLVSLVRFYKIPPEAVVILHDELDLVLGKVRVKQGGGSGGHNGIKDMDACIGNNTWRVRLGIGHPGHKDLVTAYVLGNFKAQETAVVQEMIQRMSQALPFLFQGQKDLFMTQIAEDKTLQ